MAVLGFFYRQTGYSYDLCSCGFFIFGFSVALCAECIAQNAAYFSLEYRNKKLALLNIFLRKPLPAEERVVHFKPWQSKPQPEMLLIRMFLRLKPIHTLWKVTDNYLSPELQSALKMYK